MRGWSGDVKLRFEPNSPIFCVVVNVRNLKKPHKLQYSAIAFGL